MARWIECAIMSLIYAALPYRVREEEVSPEEVEYYKWLHSLDPGGDEYVRAFGAWRA